MEIDIIEASDVDRYKDGKKAEDQEEEEEKPEAKLDILDDPVRMYLKQMGQVPLLTREQEVEISKRIEDAELNVQKHINRFGFIARAYLDLAQKLQEGRERFDRVILDKKIESRERYMKALPKLCAQLEHAAAELRDDLQALPRARRQEPRDEVVPRFQEGPRRHPAHLPEVFLQAEGHRGIRASRRRDEPAAQPVDGGTAQAEEKGARPRASSRRDADRLRREAQGAADAHLAEPGGISRRIPGR